MISVQKLWTEFASCAIKSNFTYTNFEQKIMFPYDIDEMFSGHFKNWKWNAANPCSMKAFEKWDLYCEIPMLLLYKIEHSKNTEFFVSLLPALKSELSFHRFLWVVTFQSIFYAHVWYISRYTMYKVQ